MTIFATRAHAFPERLSRSSDGSRQPPAHTRSSRAFIPKPRFHTKHYLNAGTAAQGHQPFLLTGATISWAGGPLFTSSYCGAGTRKYNWRGGEGGGA